MMAMVWFVLGLLCGVAAAAALGLSWIPQYPDDEQESRDWVEPHKEWVKTRNFLYYDGTEMPVVKEEQNEQ